MSGSQYENHNAHSGEVVAVANPNPFLREQAKHLSAGTVAVESERAIAEAQGKLVIAKRFPRDEAAAFARVMDACRRASLAAVANYAFPRAGQTVSGPSIRLAEELARCWGNIDYGLRELSRRDGESEMEAYAWDLETNVMSSQKFTARHIRDRRGGGEALRDERDIYELTANLGSRRLRARILAILPPDLVDAAVAECRRTMAGANTKPIGDQIKEATQAFVRFGVTADMIAARLGHALDDTTPDELADLREIFASLKDGMSKVADWFGAKQEAMAKPDGGKLAAIETAAKAEQPDTTPARSADCTWLLDKIVATKPAEIDALLRSAAIRAMLAKLGDNEKAEVSAAANARAPHVYGDSISG